MNRVSTAAARSSLLYHQKPRFYCSSTSSIRIIINNTTMTRTPCFRLSPKEICSISRRNFASHPPPSSSSHLSLDPNTENAMEWMQQGNAKWEAGDLEGAIDCYQKSAWVRIKLVLYRVRSFSHTTKSHSLFQSRNLMRMPITISETAGVY